MKQRTFLLICFAVIFAATCGAQYRLDPKPRRTFVHKVGALWTAITNNAHWGNTYAEPNFEWPGGSGNYYGWRASLWVGAIVDSVGYASQGDEEHFTPLDSLYVKHSQDGSLSAEDTYTRYTDVNPVSPSTPTANLGVEIVERTYAWDQSYNDDFIVSDYWIKNIGDDRNKDGIVDTTKTLTGVYIGFRMDADVSGFNGTSTDSRLWDQDDLAGYDSTNKIVYLWDANSVAVAGDDTGNPDPVTGVLRSPGYIGIRLLYADSAHFDSTYTGMPTMATPSNRYNEPSSSQAVYNFMKGYGIAANATVPRDYRGVMAIGPYTIPAGDSIRIVIAWVIGNGLKGMQANSRVAQFLFDNNYQKSATSPDEPIFTLNDVVVNGQKAVALRWQSNAERSIDPISRTMDFDGYAIYKSSRSNSTGFPIWDTLAVFVRGSLQPTDTLWAGRPFLKAWPPSTVVVGSDTLYEFTDLDVVDGAISAYAIAAFDKGDTIVGIGRLENPIGRSKRSTRVYIPNLPPTQTVGNIKVVPNPFMGSSRFNNPNPIDTSPWVNRIRFINLPRDAKISIFTLAGDLVRTIHSGEIVPTSRDYTFTGDFTGVAEWDLTTKNNQEVVSGLYVYVVESSAGTFTGKFVIMR